MLSMSQKEKKVYQFKMVLEGIEPEIWRRVQVPESYSFWDFHVAIQDAMGWEDCHLHEFTLTNPKTQQQEFIGIPDDEGWGGRQILPGWDLKIADYFSDQNTTAHYDYDFGDGWEHKIILEEILPLEGGEKYPKCLDGKRACPPEDCGGIWGYEELILIFKEPNHPDYQEKLQWLGKKFNAEAFKPELVKFSNPKKRWKKMFQGPVEF
jgi:hypothetical protein